MRKRPLNRKPLDDEEPPRREWADTCRFWASVGYWTTDEAVALSFVTDPRSRNYSELRSRDETGAITRIGTARLLAERAVAAGDVLNPTPPLAWIDWAGDQDAFEFGPTLVAAVRERHGLTPTGRTKAKPESKRQIDNMAAVITAMAIVHYGYDPDRERSTAPKLIAGDVLLGGAKVGEASIRNYLRAGALDLKREGIDTLKRKADPLIRKRKSQR